MGEGVSRSGPSGPSRPRRSMPGVKALTLIASGNEFLASLELERVRAHWEKKGYTIEEVGTEDVQALLYALDTPSLFGAGRFVVVRGSAADLEDSAERLAQWAGSRP